MSIRNKPAVGFKKENAVHARSGIKRKNTFQPEPRLNITLDLGREKLLGRPACTPHELNRIFNLKGTPHVNLNATCNLAATTKSHWSPSAQDKGCIKELGGTAQFNGNFLFKLGGLGLSPKTRKQSFGAKPSKSRNAAVPEELNATYTIKRSENRKSSASFSGKNLSKNDTSLLACQRRAKNLETYAGLLQEKIEELERELEHEKECTLFVSVGEMQNARYNEAVQALEEVNELYASLSADYAKLKKNEEDLKAKTAAIMEEKEALIKESEKKASQQRVKIMLLKEALTKRNEELSLAKKQVREMVMSCS